jgi:hypothetical protein
MSIEALEPSQNSLVPPQLELIPNREQHLATLEQIRDGASTETLLQRALQVGQSIMYVLDGTTGSLEYEIPPQVANPCARPIIHDPREPSYVALYAFQQPAVPFVSLITATRRDGKTLGVPQAIVLPRQANSVGNPAMLFATEDNYKHKITPQNTAPNGKTYEDFVAHAAGVMLEVLSTPERVEYKR